jgi:two-component system CheB/CheR fusion protein
VTNSPDNSRPLDSLRLVAIGASAGGLEPLQSFFGAMKDAPKNTALVVIQHLSPDYKSMMGELLASQYLHTHRDRRGWHAAGGRETST